MNQASDAKSAYLSAYTSAEKRLAGQSVPWVRQIRETALSRFSEIGFPTTRQEDWKYTNVSPIEKQTFSPTDETRDRIGPDDLQGFLFQGLNCHRLVFVNGHHAPELSSAEGLPAGLSVSGLAATLASRPQALQPYLGRLAPADTHGFTALNTAFLLDGAYVHLARNTVVAQPVHLLFISTPESDALAAQPRNLIVAEDGARATIIESYAAIGEARYLTNAVTEVYTGCNAAVEHYKLQQESPKAFHIGGLHVRLDRDSRFISHSISLGGALVRNDIRAVLDAEGAECDLNGLYVVTGRQHVDNYTRIDHAKPRCTSREFYKGVLDGRSRSVFYGRVVVHQDAQHTDAQQVNNNLLLSDDAEADTKPQLEIYADDVKCSHGATIGQLDANAVFYLRSRAVDEDTARSLLTYAFANDVLNRMQLAPIRTRLEKTLTDRFLHGRSIEEIA